MASRPIFVEGPENIPEYPTKPPFAEGPENVPEYDYGNRPKTPRTPRPATPTTSYTGALARLINGLGPAAVLGLLDRFSTRNDPRLPPSFVPDPGEVAARLMGLRTASSEVPFKYAANPVGTEVVPGAQAPYSYEPRTDAREIARTTGGLGGFEATKPVEPRAQVGPQYAAPPAPVAPPSFMDMIAMRERERQAYPQDYTPPALPAPTAPRREYEPGSRA